MFFFCMKQFPQRFPPHEFLSEDGLGLKDKGGPQRSWEPTDEPEPAAEESLGVPEGGARDFLGIYHGIYHGFTAGARGLPVDTPC